MKLSLYDKSKIDKDNLLFPKKALKMLLIPLVVEQVLNSLMGIADTMMVSNVGEEALSAVANVDSFNTFILQIFAALATGAVIVCSQYLGRREPENANKAAGQVVLTVLTVSSLVTLICTLFSGELLRLIFGEVSKEVMDHSRIYMFITALSYPFIALFNAGAAFMRAGGDSKYPMKISVISNILNVGGNALLIFVFDKGVAGAAISTLVSRVFCMVMLFIRLKKPDHVIHFGKDFSIKPVFAIIGTILAIGIPSGIEGGMLQFGKLAIQSSVATMTTSQMSAQAMTSMLESVTSMFAVGTGMCMMTVVGHAIGAGRTEEAKYYIVKLTGIGQLGLMVSCLIVFLLCPVITTLSDMTPETAALCYELNIFHLIIKTLFWSVGFMPAYGMRAAGDVKYCMIVSTLVMWILRVGLGIYLIRVVGMGPIAVWIAFAADWFVRALLIAGRYFSGRWTGVSVI